MTGSPKISRQQIAGLPFPMSRLVMGCDNKDKFDGAAPVWDHWIEVGGNAFDTAFVYAEGLHEAVLGEWLSARGMANEVVVIVKGGHPPHCSPEAITAQLSQSLERLRLARAPIYIMHRDNPEIPVAEFVDALNAEISKGRIGIYGGSNWSIERFEAARNYAASRGLQPPSVLNNNLSLAVMEKPVWPGCLTSHDAATLSYLTQHQIAHFSWSSQARGYFLPEALRNRLPPDSAPETCFGSMANAERRRRAETLAGERGVSANNVALAWVLAQRFPSFALVGPRNIAEIASTLPAHALNLSRSEAAWLNLESGVRAAD